MTLPSVLPGCRTAFMSDVPADRLRDQLWQEKRYLQAAGKLSARDVGQLVTFLVDGDLMEQCGSVKVDFIEAGYRSGFAITSANSLGTGGGCCSGGSCGGSCG